MAYLAEDNISWKDLQYDHQRKNKLDCDYSHDTMHSVHIDQHTDLCIFDWHKPCRMNIQSWRRILVDNQVDFQYTMANMNKRLDCWFLYIESLDRRVMVDKD